MAMLGMAILAILGLAADTGWVKYSGVQLQAAADAAALAGANVVMDDPTLARSRALSTALANKAAGKQLHLGANDANADNGDIVIGKYDRTTGVFTPTLAEPNAVKVLARRTSSAADGQVPLFFGPIFGHSGVDVDRYAIAMSEGRAVPAGFIVLNASLPKSLWVHGNIQMNVGAGTINVNSSSSEALVLDGGVAVRAGLVRVTGNYSPSSNSTITGTVRVGQWPSPDPYASLPTPDWQSMTNWGSAGKVGNSTATLDPGYYPAGISSKGNLTLRPGVYVLDGAGLDIAAQANVVGHGVMFYLKGTGAVNISGGPSMDVTPIDPTIIDTADARRYQGMLIFQDRANVAMVKIGGGSNLNLAGAIYAPTAHVNLSGNAGIYGSQVVADTAEIGGNSNVIIDDRGPLPQRHIVTFLVK
jgi:hypothetical protein